MTPFVVISVLCLSYPSCIHAVASYSNTHPRRSTKFVYCFYARQHAIAAICHANSVCPSVTRVLCIKTAVYIIEILLRPDRPIILVFRHQGSLRKSHGFNANWAPNTPGSDFRPKCSYISETVRDRGIFTIEDEYKVVCALSNGATFDDLE